MLNRRPTDRALRVTAAWLGAACLATLISRPAAAQPPTVALNLQQFEIPFNVDRSSRQPAEVQLLVSRDQGQRWEPYATQPASGKNFAFHTDQDGLYWFATRTVDASGQTDAIATLQPQLIVNVDTTSPHVNLEAWFDDQGRVQFQLNCTDQSPALDAFEVLYGSDSSRQWVSVHPVVGQRDPAAADRYHAAGQFQPPESLQQVTVRATVTDAAGNVTTVATEASRPRVAANDFRLAGSKGQLPTTAISGAAAGPPPAQPAAPPIAQSPWAIPQFAISSGLASELPRPVVSGHSSGMTLSGPATADIATMDPPSAAATPTPPAAPAATPSAAADPLASAQAPTDNTVNRAGDRPQTAAGAMRPIGVNDPLPLAADSPVDDRTAPRQQVNRAADSMNPANLHHGAAGGYGGAAPPVNEPLGDGLAASGVQVRYSNSRKFSLEYEVESTGLAGVSDVELWGSRDRGLTWKRWGADPDRQSPFDIETNNDGAYGFRIVVIAGNGLATPRPQENDLPDIFVVVDTQAPEVRITGAAYGEGDHTGSLVIRYQCSDLHLTERPISLSFAPSPSGPWTTIAAGLANEGAYLWPADPHLPRQIYLRVDGIDLAGNEGSHVLDTPIDIQGLAPRARIRGFNPLSSNPLSAAPRAAPSAPLTSAATSTNDGAAANTAAQPRARFK